jgi:hypothetical protein
VGIVEALYASREYDPVDMLDAIRRNGQNPYRAEWGRIEVKAPSGGKSHVPWLGEVVCGHNPFLAARLALQHRLGAAPLEPLRKRALEDIVEVLVDAEVALVDEVDEADAYSGALHFSAGAG